MYRLLETVNIYLTEIHAVLCMIGCIGSVYLMQLTGHHGDEVGDKPYMIAMRRVGLWVLALCLLWAVNYSDSKDWAPWPPDVAIVACVDFLIIVRSLTLFKKLQCLRIARQNFATRQSSNQKVSV